MHEDVVDAPDKIARVIIFFVGWRFRPQAVEKTDLTENDRLFGLKQCFSNPTEQTKLE